MDQVKFFKGCFSQILFGPFLNTLTQINLVVNSGVYSLFHPNSDHQTVYVKVDLKFFYRPQPGNVV